MATSRGAGGQGGRGEVFGSRAGGRGSVEDSSRSPSTFRNVAASAAEEAKVGQWRHRLCR